MADQDKVMVPINYTNREYESIRDDLMEVAERFYPDSFQDWSEGSFGSLMLDAVAYVGDQLSFYLDYNINETFLDTAYQFSNISRQGRVLGYKNTGRPSTYGKVALFVLIPASATGIGPQSGYYPILKRGTTFSTDSGLSFVLTENVDFANPTNPVVVARVDDSTGAPTYYAVKAYGNVVSGRFGQKEIEVGPYERFKSVSIKDPNITEIVTIVDSEGDQYYEVDYLSQDIVYKEISNKNYLNDNVPSVLKPMIVSRKFVVDRTSTSTIIQFGSGKAGETNVVADPTSVAVDLFGKNYVTDTTFDPTRLSKNENFGIVPSNTTLTVVYRATNGANSNVSVGSVNKIVGATLEFSDRSKLSASEITLIRSSLEVINETPITGDVSLPSSYELKQRIYDTFPTQNRAVTQADYENVIYRMPAKFGSIKRCSIQRDASSIKRNLNLYVISEDKFGKLTTTNQTIKNNLKIWLDNYRMINDTIDILDPFIINIGISFTIKSVPSVDKFDLMARATEELRSSYAAASFFIGEPFYISDIYKILNRVSGILDVVDVKIFNKSGSNYASTVLNINKNLSPDGTQVVTPRNAILEIKFPEVDIKGRIV